MKLSRTRGAVPLAALVGMLIAMGAVACSSTRGASALPSTTGKTQVSTLSPTPSPASPLEGTWQTAHLSESEVVTAYVAAGGTQKEGRAFWDQLGKKYAVITLKFLGGTISEFESADGNSAQQGYLASYELLGTNELRITDDPRDSNCVFMLSYERQGTNLKLHYASDNRHCGRDLSDPNDEPTDPAGPTIFGTFPFTLAG